MLLIVRRIRCPVRASTAACPSTNLMNDTRSTACNFFRILLNNMVVAWLAAAGACSRLLSVLLPASSHRLCGVPQACQTLAPVGGVAQLVMVIEILGRQGHAHDSLGRQHPWTVGGSQRGVKAVKILPAWRGDQHLHDTRHFPVGPSSGGQDIISSTAGGPGHSFVSTTGFGARVRHLCLPPSYNSEHAGMNRFCFFLISLALVATACGSLTESGEGGTQWDITETATDTRSGVDLEISYDSSTEKFEGTLNNTSNGTVDGVRVEIHLSNGVELGPTPKIDLMAANSSAVTLDASGQTFTWYSVHIEVVVGRIPP